MQPIGQNSACHDRINAAPKPGSIDNEDIHAIIPKLSSPDSQNDTSTSDKPPMNSSTDAEPMNKFDYAVGSFVLVPHDGHDGASSSSNRNVWVGKVVQVLKNGNENYAQQVRVHWYDRTKNTRDYDILQAALDPCYKPLGKKTSDKKGRKQSKKILSCRPKSDMPWYDTIHTDTVLFNFPSLTKKKTLPLAVQNKVAS